MSAKGAPQSDPPVAAAEGAPRKGYSLPRSFLATPSPQEAVERAATSKYRERSGSIIP
jgi:hypothetical protein